MSGLLSSEMYIVHGWWWPFITTTCTICLAMWWRVTSNSRGKPQDDRQISSSWPVCGHSNPVCKAGRCIGQWTPDTSLHSYARKSKFWKDFQTAGRPATPAEGFVTQADVRLKSDWTLYHERVAAEETESGSSEEDGSN